MHDKPLSRLQALIAQGHFVVTGECGPPRGADTAPLLRKIELLREVVDAANVTDNQTARVHMSSLAASHLLHENGLEPILQITSRDRNRLAIQADLLGARALGIRNVLCLMGDPPTLGDHPESKPVNDLDSFQVLALLRGMRENGTYQNGQPIKSGPVPFYIGAAANPFVVFGSEMSQVPHFARKVEAGADFIQTQCIFNVPRFLDWLSRVRDAGLHEKVAILAGITPLKSARLAEHMAAHVPGVDLPPELLARMRRPTPEREQEEGLAIAREVIEQLRGQAGLAGIHIMAVDWTSAVPQLVKSAGLFPRPRPSIY